MKKYPTIQETRQHHALRLRRTEEGMGRITAMNFVPSNMTAGPCDAARQAEGMRFDTRTKHLPPFDDCPHPDQCACSFAINGDEPWSD